jgi:ParB-like chromosome segregation protein Spo0J
VLGKNVPPEILKLDPKQVARHKGPDGKGTEGFRRKVESIRRHGLLQLPGILTDGTVQWGTGRILAWMEARPGEPVPVAVLDTPMPEGEYGLLVWTENTARQDWTPAEQSDQLAALLEANPGWTQKDLAERAHLSPASISNLLAVFKTLPVVQDAYRAGRITPTDCAALAKLSDQEAHELLAAKLAGAIGNRDELKRESRKRRIGQAPAVRVSRIRCPLPTGATVVVSGEGLSLDDSIEALSEALKVMRKAREDSLDARTAMAVWRQKNTKGDAA